jgi:hypothetical protein
LFYSKSTATTAEEFKKLMEKVPDFKIRPVKVRPEEIKIKEKDCKEFKLSKKEIRYLKNSQGEREKQYSYIDPVPAEMRSYFPYHLPLQNSQAQFFMKEFITF